MIKMIAMLDVECCFCFSMQVNEKQKNNNDYRGL